MNNKNDEPLLRAIGPFGFTAGVINVVVGAGIFALPASLAQELGSAAPIAFVISAVIMGLVTACMARAGRYVARSGGTYAYAEVAFGQFAGYITGIICWSSNVFASAAVASALPDLVSALAPNVMGHTGARSGLIVLLYFAFALVNLRGVTAGSRLTSTTAGIKFVSLLAFVAVGLSLVHSGNLVFDAAPTAAHLGRGAILAVFALSGMEIALSVSGEVRNPGRTIPIGLAAGMTLVCLLYISVQLVAQGALGTALPNASAPLADALTRGGFASGGVLITLAATISVCGWLAGDLLGSPRIIFAFAREGMLPSALGAVHPTRRVPHVAIIVHAVIACALALSGTFTLFAILGSITTIVLYLICCAAAWKLEQDDSGQKTPMSRLLQWWVPLSASAGLLWMISYSTAGELLAIGGVIVVGGALYWFTAASRREASASGSRSIQ